MSAWQSPRNRRANSRRHFFTPGCVCRARFGPAPHSSGASARNGWFSTSCRPPTPDPAFDHVRPILKTRGVLTPMNQRKHLKLGHMPALAFSEFSKPKCGCANLEAKSKPWILGSLRCARPSPKLKVDYASFPIRHLSAPAELLGVLFASTCQGPVARPVGLG